ncbi:MAG: hypothetical protein P4L79_01200 [Legionella sp.]|uniref:hypothetical protein n=1 Tax=Legionella sp. TaxID=459 RepID=UPI002850061F|nr:hypothetical protein [Legionella sp.]
MPIVKLPFFPKLSQDTSVKVINYLFDESLNTLSLTTPQFHHFFTQEHPHFRTLMLERFQIVNITNKELNSFEHYCNNKKITLSYNRLYRNLVKLVEHLEYVSPKKRELIKSKPLLILFCCADREELVPFISNEGDPELIFQIALLASSGKFLQKALKNKNLNLSEALVLQSALYDKPLVKKLLPFFNPKNMLNTLLEYDLELDEEAFSFISQLASEMQAAWDEITRSFRRDPFNITKDLSALAKFAYQRNPLLTDFIKKLYQTHRLPINYSGIRLTTMEENSLVNLRILLPHVTQLPQNISKTTGMLPPEEWKDDIQLFTNQNSTITINKLTYAAFRSNANTMMDYLFSHPAVSHMFNQLRGTIATDEQMSPAQLMLVRNQFISRVQIAHPLTGQYNKDFINNLFSKLDYDVDLIYKLHITGSNQPQPFIELITQIDFPNVEEPLLKSSFFKAHILNDENMTHEFMSKAFCFNNMKLFNELLHHPIIAERALSNHFLRFLIRNLKVNNSNIDYLKLFLSQLNKEEKTIVLDTPDTIYELFLFEHMDLRTLTFFMDELYTKDGLLWKEDQETLFLLAQTILDSKSLFYLIRYMGKTNHNLLLADEKTEAWIHQQFTNLSPSLESGDLWFFQLKQANGHPIMFYHALDSYLFDPSLKPGILAMKAVWQEYLENKVILKKTLETAFKALPHYFMEELLFLFEQFPESKAQFEQPLLEMLEEYKANETRSLNETHAMLELRAALHGNCSLVCSQAQ